MVAFAEDFRVALKSVPSAVHPDIFQDSSANFVLRQLFDVMFEPSRGTWVHNRKILRSWSAIDGYKQFEFCPQVGVTFTSGASFDAISLKKNIKLFAQKNILAFPPVSVVVTNRGCVVVQFSHEYASLPETLSELNTAIREPASFDKATPIGTTDYILDSLEAGKRITLVERSATKKHVSFSKIVFEEFSEGNVPIYHSIDIAMLGTPERKDAVTRKSFVSSTLPAPIGIYLAAGRASTKARKIMKSCLNRVAVGGKFLGNDEVKEMESLFPSWFGLSSGSSKSASCRDSQVSELQVKVVFKQRKSDPGLQERLIRALSDMRLPFSGVQIEGLDEVKYAEATKSVSKTYDFALVMIASHRLSYYMQRFLTAPEGQTLTGVPASKSAEFRARDSVDMDWNARTKLLGDASKFLLDEGYVTPIVEAKVTRYLSKRVQYPSEASFDGFNGYYIGDLKAK